MYTIILYVALCSSPTVCDSYEPESWTVSNRQEEDSAFEQCEAIERHWMKEKGYKESDCYIAE